MATKKKTDPEERTPSANDEASGTDESTPKAEERPSKEGSPTDDSKRSDGEDSGGQLFFSTDGGISSTQGKSFQGGNFPRADLGRECSEGIGFHA